MSFEVIPTAIFDKELIELGRVGRIVLMRACLNAHKEMGSGILVEVTVALELNQGTRRAPQSLRAAALFGSFLGKQKVTNHFHKLRLTTLKQPLLKIFSVNRR